MTTTSRAIILGTATAMGLAAMAAFAQTPGAGPETGGPGRFPDFAALDADKDGPVTRAELLAHRQADAAGMDADGNGLLSAAELTAYHLKALSRRAEAMAAQRIADHDLDGDGQLSAAELAAAPGPGRIFARLDQDDDGAVSQAEFDAARARREEGGGRHEPGRGGHRRDHGPGGRHLPPLFAPQDAPPPVE